MNLYLHAFRVRNARPGLVVCDGSTRSAHWGISERSRRGTDEPLRFTEEHFSTTGKHLSYKEQL